ncbi:hypothetical protein [Nostoc sp.]|uniref:hypothetical protein n=1 Tax=Nostoc sp. TaxID=1180 RepID=UPI002FFC762F
MNFDPKVWGFFLSLFIAASGWVAAYLNKLKSDKQQNALERQQAIQKAEIAAEKAVNDKRDFNHLINNQVEICKNIAYGFKDIENQVREVNKEVQEVKAYLIRNQQSQSVPK